ncbi:MAG TPA: hypothetical protein VGN54_03000 [Mycobacteriales bacterium]|jgi:hypothetical protein|nr:hypothetical protein [Mycobacteriales bacterium]
MTSGRIPTAGDRRAVSADVELWALEQHDGRLWQIVALATTPEGCRAFLGLSREGPAVPAN